MGERRLRELAEALCKRLRTVHSSDKYKGIWSFAHNHGLSYDGPTYAAELEALETYLHGEAKEQPDAWEAFIAVGWKLSHHIANGEICSDRSCFRCRLADLLFDAEKRMPRKEQP